MHPQDVGARIQAHCDILPRREGVLLGTVRGLALDMCKELGIGVDETVPLMSESQYWDEFMVSSTSRWVLPCREIVMPDKSVLKARSTELGDKVYKALVNHALEKSTKIDG